MREYSYDFHVHSCLSPCGDNEMTPQNIVAMALLAECEILAITDHNSCGNASAVMEAAEDTELLVLAGMELCVSEEAHVVCLFDTIKAAMAFDSYVHEHSLKIKNRPEIFGEQRLCDSKDRVLGLYENLLINAADIGLNQVIPLVSKLGGCAFPAHVDRSSYSVIASLGTIPPEANFTASELSSAADAEEFIKNHKDLSDMLILRNSDAHCLEDLAGEKHKIPLKEKSARAVINRISAACSL